MSMSDYGVKIGIKANTGIMLLKPSTLFRYISRFFLNSVFSNDHSRNTYKVT